MYYIKVTCIGIMEIYNLKGWDKISMNIWLMSTKRNTCVIFWNWLVGKANILYYFFYNQNDQETLILYCFPFLIHFLSRAIKRIF